MSDLKNILDDGTGKLPEDKLIAYLEGRLSPGDAHEVEKWLANEGLESDAIEGLQQIEINDAKDAVKKVNLHLQKVIKTKKKKRRYITDNPWAIIAIVTIILLVIVAYLVLRLMVKK